MQQDVEKIMKNIEINRANLKLIILLIALCITWMMDGIAIALPLVLQEQDRAFEEEKFAG